MSFRPIGTGGSMAFSKTKKTGWAFLALMAAVGTAAVLSVGSASLVEDPELSPAEIVALRFPAEAEGLASPSSAQADRSSPRDIEAEVLASPSFNTERIGLRAPA